MASLGAGCSAPDPKVRRSELSPEGKIFKMHFLNSNFFCEEKNFYKMQFVNSIFFVKGKISQNAFFELQKLLKRKIFTNFA